MTCLFIKYLQACFFFIIVFILYLFNLYFEHKSVCVPTKEMLSKIYLKRKILFKKLTLLIDSFVAKRLKFITATYNYA